MNPISYRYCHFPPDVVQHAVWLYFRFTLSLRDAEDLLAEFPQSPRLASAIRRMMAELIERETYYARESTTRRSESMPVPGTEWSVPVPSC